MELALYCPLYGYYEKEKDKLGRRGDFFTSVSAGSLFGELLAFQFAQWLQIIQTKNSLLKIVEAGAHDGRLAKDILAWLREHRPNIFDAVTYCLVEPSAARSEWQKESLAGFKNKTLWVSRLEDLSDPAAGGGICGIIFGNELLDAMPVHRFGWDAASRQWFEWGVRMEGDRFAWAKIPGAGHLPELPDALLRILPNQFTTEISPAAQEWWTGAAGVLQRGKLVAIDYGLAAEEFFSPERSAGTLRGYHRHHVTNDLLRHGSCDVAYTLTDRARFRINIFSQRGHYSIVCRKLNTEIPTLEWLEFPEIIRLVPREKTGLVLVTGATGAGKSTTLAAILNEINHTKPVHVITLEDPVEFIHPHYLATFNQRELGTDFDNFANGLRAALRQAPKIILVGEMRDRETVKIALSAAETGHLVLSTLHTIDAGQTINRILGMFEPAEQEQIRARLADTLRWVVSQRLVPKVGGGRHALLEIMGSNLRVQETIRLGESEGKSFYEIIEASQPFGWRTFDYSALEAYAEERITEETALLYCTKRGPVTRGIDQLKKSRGESTTTIGSLRMQNLPDRNAPKPGAPAIPATLKLK